MLKIRLLAIGTALALLAGCAVTPDLQVRAPDVPEAVLRGAPEVASGYTEKPGWVAKKFMVAAANPLATDAGYEMLKAGGSAIDAAIAVQMVLTLVEPQSSGIGGGAFLLHADRNNVIKAFDGRETAPALATGKLFQSADGTVMDLPDAMVGGRAVGVPGVLRMLDLAHRQHGKLPWATLFEPAIKLAESGFAISPRLATLLRADPYLKMDASAAAYFYDRTGNPWAAGHRLKNPALAAVMRMIATEGAAAFYRGGIARGIVAKVNSHPINPGRLSLTDVAGYQAKVREPVCSGYRIWIVCGMPPPSSGGITIAQILGMLETKNMSLLAPQDGVPQAEAVHLFAEAGRLAYADRNRYVADPDFVPLLGNSVLSLLDKDYLRKRAALIGERSMGIASAGMPPALRALARGTGRSPELPSTSHIAVVDAQGNAVSMTTSIEDAFGARQMVHGFLLNNQLTDFSFNAVDANGRIANRVQGGKRPRSSMSPTLVFEKDSKKLVLVVGSPGGSAIINYVAKVLIGTMDWGLNVQQAIDLPNFGSRNGPTELEQGRFPLNMVGALRRRGHMVKLMDQTSGLQGIMRISVHGEDMWLGGADPRREGVAKGD